MSIDQSDVKALSKLARLDLSPDETTAFGEQLPKIIEYVGQLQSVRTDIIPEVTPPAAGWRTDRVDQKITPDDILAQAPEKNERYWRVPSVF